MSQDFLATHQPTASTVRALWYLHHFQQQGNWSHGFAFEKQLRACQLDYTLGSLHRIDALLDQIRTKLKPSYERFVNQQDVQQFLFTLAFYCGEMRGRLAKVPAVWQTWQELNAEQPSIAQSFPYSTEHQFVAHYPNTDLAHFFPLISILARLFPKDDEQISSVYASAITGDVQQFDLTDVIAEPPAQSLSFALPQAIAQTPKAQLPYLQILPPSWMQTDKLICQIDALPKLYRKGRVVWGALVQANKWLFEHGNAVSCPAEIIYDKSGRTPPEQLREYASKLFKLKNTTPDNPELAEYAQHLSNERTRQFCRIPQAISHMPVYSASVLIWRPHLPNGIITMPIFPIMITDDEEAVSILPARYWMETQLYRDWLQAQAVVNEAENAPERSSQETVYAFEQIAQKEPNFWAGYEEWLSPQASELPELASQATEDSAENSIQYETDQAFIVQCREAVIRTYARYEEVRHAPKEAEIKACVDEIRSGKTLQDTHSALSVYARLRVLGEDADFWAECIEPTSAHADKIAKLLQKPQLNSLQTAKLVRILNRQAHEIDPNITPKTSAIASLYLANLYLTGRFVPQSIREASHYLFVAMGKESAFANKCLAEWLARVPELAPMILLEPTKEALSNIEMEWFNAQILNQNNIKQWDEQIHAFFNHRSAQLEMVRQKLQLASEQGHPTAQARLQQLIDDNVLPPQASEPRFEDVMTWLKAHFVMTPDEDDDDEEREEYEILSSSMQSTEHPLSHFDGQWKKWGIIGAGLVLVGAGIMGYSGKSKSDAPTVSPATPSKVDSVPPSSAVQDNHNVALKQAVESIASIAPVQLKMANHLTLTGSHLQKNGVLLEIADSGQAIMSIENAQTLYCQEWVFEPFRQARPEQVQWSVQMNNGTSYLVDIKACP